MIQWWHWLVFMHLLGAAILCPIFWEPEQKSKPSFSTAAGRFVACIMTLAAWEVLLVCGLLKAHGK